MRRWYVPTFLIVSSFVVTGFHSQSSNSQLLGDESAKNVAQAAQKSDAAPAKSSTAAASPTVDEPAIQKIASSLSAAYKAGDAKTFAALFTLDAEFIDPKGVVFQGRSAIEAEFVTLFKELPGSTIDIEINSIRSIAPGLISADCTTRFKQSASATVSPGQCRLIAARDADRWMIASLTESEMAGATPAHHAQVSQLEWMIGEWVGEGLNSHLHFSCRWDESGKYLLRHFTIRAAGKETVSGTQRIGYDPVAEHLKMWVFDSAGGFSSGDFYRDGEKWILRTTGVTSSGHVASSTNAFTLVDKSRITIETLDRMIAGERIAESEKVTLIRTPTRRHARTNHSEKN